MKKLFTLTVIVGLALAAYGQAPQKMSYQCVVRNSAGALVASQAVGLKISILKGTATGTVVFSETYTPVPQTNANGLLTVEIGGGTAMVGTFAGIDWSAGPYFLKTEMDPAGGASYTITGTSQLQSVPYALYSKTAANGFSGAWADITGKPIFATVATSGSYNDLLNRPSLFSGSYNDLTNKPVLFDGTWTSLTGKPVLFDGTWTSLTGKPVLFDGTWTSLSGKPAGFTDGIDNVDDADNSITNEIQALSLSGTVLSLSSGGGSVTLPSSGGGDNWGTQTAVTNTTLTGVGTTASPLAVANTVITPSWSHIQSIPAGFADGTDNIDDADNSITNEIQALSLSGTVLSLSSGGGSVTLPSSGGGDNWGTQTVVTNTTLTGVGTTASPLAVANTVITPTWSHIQSIPAGFADGTDNIDDADNSITNEIQTINLSGTTLTLSSGGGSVTLPSSGGGDNWGTQVVVTDVSLAGNGTTATPLRIADNGVTTAKIASGAVTTAKILDGTVSNADLSDNSVTTLKIADGAIATADLANSTVTTDKLGNLAVSAEKIQNGAVTSDKLATNSVTSVKIAAAAVTGDKIAQSGATAGQVLKWNSTTWAPADDLTGGGSLTLPYSGSISSASFGLSITNSTNSAISGKSTSSGGEYVGVYGETESNAGSGVHGKGSYLGVGVMGEGGYYGVLGTGVVGIRGWSEHSEGTGVQGINNSTTGITCGGNFSSNSSEGYGVYGVSPRNGVYGTSSASTGRAVTGEATGTASIGVYGLGLETSSTGVWGEGANQGVYGTSPSATGKGVYGQVSSATAFSGYFEGGKFYINSNTGIKTTDPTQALDVNGNARIRSIGSGAYSGVVNRTSDGTLTTATSDGRLKENINTLTNSLEKVMQLHGVTFTWKGNPEYGTRIGFVAQEFEKVIPELVFTNEVDGYKGINYAEVSAVLVEAIKEQQKEIDELKAIVSSLLDNK